MRAAAVYAARLGWPVIPLHDVVSGHCSCARGSDCPTAGKHPRLANWVDEASSDAKVIAGWISDYPDANIGVATGAIFFALDVDPAAGGVDTLARLCSEHGPLPITPAQRTGSGGTHYLFQPVARLRNSVCKLGLGLDIRAAGGQIVLAPSVSAKGSYQWIRPPWDIPIAPAPDWLLDLLRVAPVPVSGGGNTERGWFPPADQTTLEFAALALDRHGPAVQGQGGDAHTLIAAAILTHDWALTLEEARPLLDAWNRSCDPPWSAGDLATKLANGSKYGSAEFGRARALDALDRAKKEISDWRTRPTAERDMTAMVARVREIARHAGDPVRHAQIVAALKSETGLAAKSLAVPDLRSEPSAPAHGQIDAGAPLHVAANAATAAIAPFVFSRNGILCEVVPGDRPGRAFISDLETTRIQDLMSASAVWTRDVDGARSIVAAPLPIAAILRSRRIHSRVRVIESVTTAPAFLADGSILNARGYNAQARMYLEPSVAVDVLDSPTLTDARDAVAILRDLVCDYKFASPADFAAWLAGLLTPLSKSAVGNAPAPLFLVTASSKGVGKTKLVQLASIIATGAEVGTTPYGPKDLAEWTKKLTALVRAAQPICVFDNLCDEIGDGGLDRLITSTVWSDRILGVSEAPPLPVVTTWWGSGNNVDPRGDTVRRCLPIRLETDSEKPQDRDDFKRPELEAFASEYRATYLSSALTILRAYHCAGRPPQEIQSWGSFGAWSALVRSALVYAGCADPIATQRRVTDQTDESDTTAHDFWIEVLENCDGSPVAICAAADAAGASTRLGCRETITPFHLRRFIGRFVDRPRRQKRIRQRVSPSGHRYEIERID